MKEVISVSRAMEQMRSGMRVMIAGFLGVGSPLKLIDGLLETGCTDLTLIANDADHPGRGIGKLIAAKRVRKGIFTHIGKNPEVAEQMRSGDIDVELVPQGTMSERMRCAGAGLGGVLTPTGVGTLVAEGKQCLTVNGKEYLLEMPLAGDVALIKAHIADKAGNLVFRRAARNFNPLMAMGGGTVIVEAEHIVDVGELDPDAVMIPGVFVSALVQG